MIVPDIKLAKDKVMSWERIELSTFGYPLVSEVVTHSHMRPTP